MTAPRSPMTAAVVPSLRAAWLLAAAAPLALAIAATRPGLWILAPALGAALFVMVLVDALLAPACTGLRLIAPDEAEVGEAVALTVLADFARSPGGAPEAALALDPRLHPGGRLVLRLAPEQGAWSGVARPVPTRRGAGAVSRVWLRWHGPFGLATRQVSLVTDHALRVRPNIAPVRSPALSLYLRDAEAGMIVRRIRGEGTEFEALADYEPGMDKRRIHWKSSARHGRLFAREYESERNLPIVFAFDCGQAMCEPVDGIARIDRAVTAALTAAWVALKAGDRVSLFGFAARPLVATPFESGTRGFHRLQRAAADLDYHSEDANFTWGLATLATRLQRRALIVIFAEFTDPTAAGQMLAAIGRLIERHRVLFVVMEDAELTAIARAEPTGFAAVARAVTATALARQRALVLESLRRMGVRVVEAPWQALGLRLIDSYFAEKRKGTIA